MKTYTTFNKIRFSLFCRTYAHHYISDHLKIKYEINERLNPKKLHKEYSSKRAIPELSRLSKVLNFNYTLLWKSIIQNKSQPLSKKVNDKEKIEIYLSIESELISLMKAKRSKSNYRDSDYEDEFGLLTTAIERAIGNALDDVEDDLSFAQESEELKRKYIYLYYKVAYKYKLPTLRIIPFIIRLIA